MLGRGAGVVIEPLQRQVHALAGEHRERPGFARHRLVGAVGDGVVDAAQLGQHERGLELARLGVADVGGGGFDDKRQRDRPTAHADHHGHAVVAYQALDLVAVIVGQQFGAGDRGAVDPGVGNRAPGWPAVGDHGFEIDRDAQVGIAGMCRGRQRLPLGEGVEARADRANRGIVDFTDASQRRVGVGELGQLIGRMGGREDRGIHSKHDTPL